MGPFSWWMPNFFFINKVENLISMVMHCPFMIHTIKRKIAFHTWQIFCPSSSELNIWGQIHAWFRSESNVSCNQIWIVNVEGYIPAIGLGLAITKIFFSNTDNFILNIMIHTFVLYLYSLWRAFAPVTISEYLWVKIYIGVDLGVATATVAVLLVYTTGRPVNK